MNSQPCPVTLGHRLKNNMNIFWIHSLRATAMIMVIILHAAAPILYRLNKVPLTEWVTGNVYDSLMRACVPIFFMISGFLLLSRDEPISDFLKKRASKIMIPLAFWSIFYLLWKIYFEGFKVSLTSGLLNAIFTPTYFHLWFVYSIAGLYLAIPIIRKFTTSATNSQLFYFIAIWFFTCSLLPIIEKNLHIKSKYDLFMFGGYLGYMILGQLLGRLQYRNIHAIAASFLILLCWGITTTGTHYLSLSKGAFSDNYYGYFAPAVTLAAAAQFILFKHVFSKFEFSEHSIPNRVIVSLSTLSFGIYLIHGFYLSALKAGTLGIKISVFSTTPILAIPLTSVSILALSYITIYTMSKAPLLKKLI